MKKFIAGFVSGALIFSFLGVFAYNIYENPYKILVNGQEKYIQGYNVDDYSYFKLRDIADAVGGFDVDFNNNTIQISKDGYVYDNSEPKSINLSGDMKDFLSDFCLRVPDFTQSDLSSGSFARDFIFYYFNTGREGFEKIEKGFVLWDEDEINEQYKTLFGRELPKVVLTDDGVKCQNGFYYIMMSDFGTEEYLFKQATKTSTGIEVVFDCVDEYDQTFYGTTTLNLVNGGDEDEYYITSKTSVNIYSQNSSNSYGDSTGGSDGKLYEGPSTTSLPTVGKPSVPTAE